MAVSPDIRSLLLLIVVSGLLLGAYLMVKSTESPGPLIARSDGSYALRPNSSLSVDGPNSLITQLNTDQYGFRVRSPGPQRIKGGHWLSFGGDLALGLGVKWSSTFSSQLRTLGLRMHNAGVPGGDFPNGIKLARTRARELQVRGIALVYHQGEMYQTAPGLKSAMAVQNGWLGRADSTGQGAFLDSFLRRFSGPLTRGPGALPSAQAVPFNTLVGGIKAELTVLIEVLPNTELLLVLICDDTFKETTFECDGGIKRALRSVGHELVIMEVFQSQMTKSDWIPGSNLLTEAGHRRLAEDIVKELNQHRVSSVSGN